MTHHELDQHAKRNVAVEVYTMCSNCGRRFDWDMKPSVEAPDCPHCGFDATGREWSRKQREQRGDSLKFHGHSDSVFSVDFSLDGKLLASGSGDCSVRVWDVETQKQIAVLHGHDISVNAVRFLSDGKRLVSAGADGAIRLWDINEKKIIASGKSHSGSIMCMELSPNGSTVAIGSSGEEPTIQLCDVNSLNEVSRLFMKSRVNGIAWSTTGDRIATANEDGTVTLIDSSSPASLQVVIVSPPQDGSKAVGKVAFSPDSKLLASCTYQTVLLRDANTLVRHATLTPDDSEYEGKLADGRVYHMDAKNGSYGIAFSPDGELLVTVGDIVIRVWNVKSAKRIKTIHGAANTLFCVSFKPFDASAVVTGGSEANLYLRFLTDFDIPKQSTMATNEPTQSSKSWWQFWK